MLARLLARAASRSQLFEFQGATARTVGQRAGRLVPSEIYSRGMKLLRTVGVVMSCWCLLLASASSGAADGTGASRLFARGANLCKLVSTAKLKVATGLKLPQPTWNGDLTP